MRRLEPSGACNLLKAVKHILNVKNVDYILIVLGAVGVIVSVFYN